MLDSKGEFTQQEAADQHLAMKRPLTGEVPMRACRSQFDRVSMDLWQVDVRHQ